MKTISIGSVARLLGVSIETLRNWDRSGKLVAIRSQSGQRRYAIDQIETFRENHNQVTAIVAHCIKVSDFKEAVNHVCEGFDDEDVVEVTFHKNEGFNGAVVTLEDSKRSFSHCLQFDEDKLLEE